MHYLFVNGGVTDGLLGRFGDFGSRQSGTGTGGGVPGRRREGVQAPSVDIDRATEFVTIATGPTSGIYYPIGGAFATVLGNAGYKTSAQATGASVENINLITAGEAELAIYNAGFRHAGV